jgi:hypothetical protein
MESVERSVTLADHSRSDTWLFSADSRHSFIVLCSFGIHAANGLEDMADVRSKGFSIPGHEVLQYVLIGSKEKRLAPQNGYRVLVVMPGGDGSAEVTPFFYIGYKHRVPR